MLGSMLSFSRPPLVFLVKVCNWKVFKIVLRTEILVSNPSSERQPRAFIVWPPLCNSWGHCELNSVFYSVLKVVCGPCRCQGVAGSLTDRSEVGLAPALP